MAGRFLYYLLRRDIVPPLHVAKFFLDQTISPQPTIRTIMQRLVVIHTFLMALI